MNLFIFNSFGCVTNPCHYSTCVKNSVGASILMSAKYLENNLFILLSSH